MPSYNRRNTVPSISFSFSYLDSICLFVLLVASVHSFDLGLLFVPNMLQILFTLDMLLAWQWPDIC
jgi:hypothetical protein